MNTKQMPYSMEAEQGVVASLIIDYNKINEISELLLPEYFYNRINKIVYEQILEVYSEKKTLDLIILKSHLESTNKLVDIGGMDYIVDLVEAIQTSELVKNYAKIVYDKYVIREVIEKASNILNTAYGSNNAQELIEYSEKEIFELSNLTRSEDFINWQKLLETTQEKIIELANQEKRGLTGLSTGYKALDKITNGLQKSDLLVLAARPSVGKTAFALNLCKNVAKSSHNKKANVAFFSLEMSAEQLLHRLIAMESAIPINKIRNGELNKEEQEILNYGIDSLSEMNIFVDDTPGIKISDLKSKARKLKVEQGLDFILIDYLQLITTSYRNDNRQQEVSEISRELKGLAKELEIPILSLSQLSRSVEQRADKKPMMSDIRESGAIEQDADIIMMLYRPEYYQGQLENEEEENSYDGKTELIISKHRNGSTGTLEFKFLKEINKFTQVSTEIDA